MPDGVVFQADSVVFQAVWCSRWCDVPDGVVFQAVSVVFQAVWRFSSPLSSYLSHRTSARIQNLILRKLMETPWNLGLNPLPHHVSHFGPPLVVILNF